ncbi:MAG: hypothetical protein ACXVHL_30050 [Solirubrobacteraceae bacterium]
MAAILVLAAVLIGVAQARTIFLSHYSGNTSQRFKGKPSPSVSLDVDRTHKTVYYIGIAYSCSARSKQYFISRIHPSLKHGSINRKGDFRYNQTSRKSHLTWISGHVTKAKITGQFAATHSCNAKGTYTAKLGGK